MEANKPELTGLFKDILDAMNDATRKLVEETAATDGSLVISINGEVKKVPAKDLLPKVFKSTTALSCEINPNSLTHDEFHTTIQPR